MEAKSACKAALILLVVQDTRDRLAQTGSTMVGYHPLCVYSVYLTSLHAPNSLNPSPSVYTCCKTGGGNSLGNDAITIMVDNVGNSWCIGK